MEKLKPNLPIIVNCLDCKGLVRVPVDAPADSLVKCPHCSKEFGLAVLLAEAIPELEVVSKQKVEITTPSVDKTLKQSNDFGERQKFVVPSQLKEGARRRSRRSRRDSDSAEIPPDSSNGEAFHTPDLVVDESELTAKSERSRSGSSRRSSSRRSRRKSRSSNSTAGGSGSEFIKVILGGLLAIPIAYLLVLGLFKQDPLKLAPTIENVAPFLVPAEMRSDAEPEKEEAETRPSGDDDDEPIIDLSEKPLPISKVN